MAKMHKDIAGTLVTNLLLHEAFLKQPVIKVADHVNTFIPLNIYLKWNACKYLLYFTVDNEKKLQSEVK